MATNFTNKYMQVFQNYNEFGEHSADYVRGEDHIAFLIEENEVIYWLYLEQVWRPLNVRTTTTGQLEDGRTKVAVRLEYIEGGQKYTSVPNIPDPERITSMSHFLEDYPDIEEVNVSGTVNLTNLSYAFAGSKIKDFSMLDTSNVDNIYGFINNISNNDLIINFSTNKELGDFKISDVDINKLTITANRKNDNSLWSFIDFNCNELELISNKEQYSKITVSGSSIDTIKNENGQVTLQYSADGGYNNFINNVYAFITRINCDSITAESININGDICILYESSRDTYIFKYKAFVNVNNLIIGTGSNRQMYIQFGSGIKYNENVNIDINIANNKYIPSFIFTTPIVDDAFYAKYAQYNTPISIFQYKTTFEEVADVNISSEVDSSLLYINWSNIYFDVSTVNVEIYNLIDLISDYNNVKFNKLILDNSSFTKLEYDDIPRALDIERITFNEGYISGNYRGNGIESDSRVSSSYPFKNIVLWDYVSMTIIDGDDLTTKNITFKNKNFNRKIRFNIGHSNNNLDLSNLIDNNVINVNIYGERNSYNQYISGIKYIDGVTYNIGDSLVTPYNNNLQEAAVTAFYNIIDENNKTYFNQYLSFGVSENIPKKESIYLNGTVYIKELFSVSSKVESLMKTLHINNIYGDDINIILDFRYSSYDNYKTENDNYKHIDIKTVSCHYIPSYLEFTICYFNELDEESTINLVTKLIDNTSESIKSIYMYRSQANIIGEENIAAAVAKNYEFAIIEN